MSNNELLRLLAIQVIELCDSVQRWLQDQQRILERLDILERERRGYTAVDEQRDMQLLLGGAIKNAQ